MASSITAQDDRLANMGAEQSVLSRAIYGAPQGDSAIIRSRSLMVYDSDKSTYTANETIRVDIASRTHFLDTSRSYIQFKIKFHQLVSGASVTTNGWVVDVNNGATNNGLATFTHGNVDSATLVGGTSYLQGYAGNEFGFAGDGVDRAGGATAIRANAMGIAAAARAGLCIAANECASKNWGMRHWFRKDGDSQNLVQTLRWVTRKGAVLESISDYNQLARTRQTVTWTEDEKENRGKIYGHGVYSQGMSFRPMSNVPSSGAGSGYIVSQGEPYSVPQNKSGAIDISGQENFVVGTEPGVVPLVAHANQQEAIHNLDLECSGIWRFPQFLPIYAMEGVRLEITLAAFATAMKGARLIKDHNTFELVGSYLISEFKLYAEMVELSAPMKVSLEHVIQTSGLPLFVPSWLVNSTNPGASQSLNIRIHDRLSHATAVWIWAQSLQVGAEPGGTALTGGYSDALDHQHMKVTSFQIRIGTASLPDTPFSVADATKFRQLDSILYNEFCKTVGTFGPQSRDALPLYDRWSRIKVENAAGDAEAVTLNGHRAALDNFSYYTLGMSLQTSPGVDGSGTIIGDVADLQILISVAKSLETIGMAPTARKLFVAVQYDRLIMIKDGGLAEVTV